MCVFMCICVVVYFVGTCFVVCESGVMVFMLSLAPFGSCCGSRSGSVGCAPLMRKMCRLELTGILLLVCICLNT